MRAHRPGPVAWLRVVLAIAARPGLWLTAVRQGRRLARQGWWRHPPFLPVPGPGYMAFRMETQYGDGLHRPEAADVVHYLSWCQQMARLETAKR